MKWTITGCKSENVWKPTFLFWCDGCEFKDNPPLRLCVATAICPAHQEKFTEDNRRNMTDTVNDFSKKKRRPLVVSETMLIEWEVIR